MASQHDTDILKNEVWDLLAELGIYIGRSHMVAWYGVHGAIVEMPDHAMPDRLTATHLKTLAHSSLVRWYEHNAASETISIGLTYEAVKKGLLDGGEL